MRVRAMALGMALGVTLLPAVAVAGGRPLTPAPGAIRAHADFRQTSAFGSPGGFPLPIGVPPMGAAGRVGGRVHHHPGVRPVFPVGTVYASPFYTTAIDPPEPVVSPAPVVYVSPTVYVSVPAAPIQPAPVVAAPPPPPAGSVVEYPTGRYELRGDGLASPYAWVWIPNAPPGPPPARDESPSARTPAAERSRIYRWTDEDGAEVWSNRRARTPASHQPGEAGGTQLVSQP